MVNEFQEKKCVYCLTETESIIPDNTFGQAWYGGSSPDDSDWLVPSCTKCKLKYEKLEYDFLYNVGLNFSFVELQTLPIPREHLDFIRAKTAEEKMIHEHVKTDEQKLFNRIVAGNPIPRSLTHVKANANEAPMLFDIKKLASRFVRALAYSKTKQYIDRNHRLEIYFRHELNPAPVIDAIQNLGGESYCGLGLKISAAFAKDDPASGLFEISIWERLKMYIFVQ